MDINYDVPQMIIDLVKERIRDLTFEEQMFDDIPDYRRSRKEGKATKRESIIVFRRNKRRF